MLHQNWFYQEGMELIAENPETQVFYDCVSECFYVVEEFQWNDGSHVRITEHTDDSGSYGTLMKYKSEAVKNGSPALFLGI